MEELLEMFSTKLFLGEVSLCNGKLRENKMSTFLCSRTIFAFADIGMGGGLKRPPTASPQCTRNSLLISFLFKKSASCVSEANDTTFCKSFFYESYGTMNLFRVLF